MAANDAGAAKVASDGLTLPLDKGDELLEKLGLASSDDVVGVNGIQVGAGTPPARSKDTVGSPKSAVTVDSQLEYHMADLSMPSSPRTAPNSTKTADIIRHRPHHGSPRSRSQAAHAH